MGQEPTTEITRKHAPTEFHNNLQPAHVSPPGALIRREIQARGWKQAGLARLIRRPTQFVSELIAGKRELTVDTAMRLEAALGPSAMLWLRLEQRYRLHRFQPDQELLEKIRIDSEESRAKAV